MDITKRPADVLATEIVVALLGRQAEYNWVTTGQFKKFTQEVAEAWVTIYKTIDEGKTPEHL